jgi:hypothetical protein
MIQIKKNLSIIMMAVFVLSFAYMLAVPASVSAVNPNALFWGNQQAEVQNALGLGNAQDPRIIAASIINVILGFLGLIAVVIILLGGFKWMTAAGNEDKIGEAKGLLVAGLIGLIIIIASWGISKFVLNLVFNAVNG